MSKRLPQLDACVYFMTAEEVLSKAGQISPSTLKRWEKDGTFPNRTKLGGRRVGWRSDLINSWMNGNRNWGEK